MAAIFLGSRLNLVIWRYRVQPDPVRLENPIQCAISTVLFSFEGFLLSTVALVLIVLAVSMPSNQGTWLPQIACLFGFLVISAVLAGWVIRVISWLKHGQPGVLHIRKLIQLKNGYWIRAEDSNGNHFRPSLCSDPGAGSLSEGCTVRALVNTNKHRWLFIPLNSSHAEIENT